MTFLLKHSSKREIIVVPLGLLLSYCAAVGKLLHISVPNFSHLENGDNDTCELMPIFQGGSDV